MNPVADCPPFFSFQKEVLLPPATINRDGEIPGERERERHAISLLIIIAENSVWRGRKKAGAFSCGLISTRF